MDFLQRIVGGTRRPTPQVIADFLAARLAGQDGASPGLKRLRSVDETMRVIVTKIDLVFEVGKEG